MYSRIKNFSAQRLDWFQRNPGLTKGLATAAGLVAGSGMLDGHQIFYGPAMSLPLSIASSYLPEPWDIVGGAALGGGMGYVLGSGLSAPPRRRKSRKVMRNIHGRRRRTA